MLNLKAKFEGDSSNFSLKALRFRRFQVGFDRVNLHRPALDSAAAAAASAAATRVASLLPPVASASSARASASCQGLTLVHFSAQLEPCLTQ